MKKLFLDNKLYLLLYACLFFVAIIIQLTFSNTYISIAVNAYHNSFLDLIGSYGTYLGDGIFIVAFSLLLFFSNKYFGFISLVSYSISAIVVQALKRLVFSDANRPAKLIDISSLHIVPGVEIHQYNSFPSGHSAAAFAFFTCLALFYRNPLAQIFFLVLAVFTAYTRIYLLQHFFQDTLVGSVIGVVTSLLVYYWLMDNKKVNSLFSLKRNNV